MALVIQGNVEWSQPKSSMTIHDVKVQQFLLLNRTKAHTLHFIGYDSLFELSPDSPWLIHTCLKGEGESQESTIYEECGENQGVALSCSTLLLSDRVIKLAVYPGRIAVKQYIYNIYTETQKLRIQTNFLKHFEGGTLHGDSLMSCVKNHLFLIAEREFLHVALSKNDEELEMHRVPKDFSFPHEPWLESSFPLTNEDGMFLIKLSYFRKDRGVNRYSKMMEAYGVPFM